MMMRKADKNIWALESASLFSDSFLPSVLCFDLFIKKSLVE